jgi:hypothetical protein
MSFSTGDDNGAAIARYLAPARLAVSFPEFRLALTPEEACA